MLCLTIFYIFYKRFEILTVVLLKVQFLLGCDAMPCCLVSHYNYHHHHLANMELGHLLTRSGLTHLEVSLRVSLGFFCLLVWSFLVFTVMYKGAFCLYVATNSFCIPAVCPKLGLYLVLLQSLCLFYNLYKCILLFFSYM
jgi:hypothetical protein